MKILMLTSSYPTRTSNLGSFIQNIVKGLTEQKVEVGVLVFGPIKKFRQYKKDGATIYEYPYTSFFQPMLNSAPGMMPSMRNSMLARFQLFGYFLSTRRYLKKLAGQYDLIHCHWFIPSGLIACMIKRANKKPILTTAWGAEFHLPTNFLVKKMLNFVNTKSDTVVAVSNYMKRQAVQYGIETEHISVIPNSVDISQFSLPRKKSDKIVIGAVRRLVPEKRIDDLIIAVGRLPAELKRKVRLWIIGDGPEKQKLVNMAEKQGLDKITKFWGMVPHDRIPFLLSQIDMCVNPSIQEGMATANIEAMAAGCCLVAVDGVGNDEVVSDKSDGFLYKSGSVDGLSKILRNLIIDKRLRKSTGIKAIRKARSFSNLVIVARYIELYKSLISYKK